MAGREEGGIMDVAERMKLVRMIEKMNEDKEFTRRIGLRDVSVFQKSGKQKEHAMM